MRTGIELTPRERAALRDHGLVMFEDRIVRDAQAPITEEELAAVAARCAGPLPKGLIALWRTTFGGRVDYDLSGDFDGVTAAISFRELFYPESGGYRDLWGWIDHEAELARSAVEATGAEWSGKLEHLPFGGFEYASRMYVRVAPGPDHGAVVAWEQGLPPAWRLRLHHDAVARIGPDIASLFATLAFDDDPRDGAASELVEAIHAVSDETLRTKLLMHIGNTVLDWRAALATGSLASEPRRARLAFHAALRTDDEALLGQIAAAGADIRMEIAGGGSVLHHALARNAQRCVRWLIERDVPVVNALEHGAKHVSLALATELLKRGAVPDVRAALDAADGGDLDAALVLGRAVVATDPSAAQRLATEAGRRAQQAEESARKIEQKVLSSRETPDGYRRRASILRQFADRVTRGGAA